MKNVKLEVRTRGCETLVATLSGNKDDGRVVKQDINLSGNSTTSALWGAKMVVDALKDMEEK